MLSIRQSNRSIKLLTDQYSVNTHKIIVSNIQATFITLLPRLVSSINTHHQEVINRYLLSHENTKGHDKDRKSVPFFFNLKLGMVISCALLLTIIDTHNGP
jgi:hypothetical protein